MRPYLWFLASLVAGCNQAGLLGGPTGVAHQETHLFYQTSGGVFAAKLDGSGPIQLSPALRAGGTVAAGFRLTPDGSKIVYAADTDGDGALELYASNTDGSGGAKINGDGSVGTVFDLSANGNRVVFFAGAPGVEDYQLHAVDLDGTHRVALETQWVTGIRVAGDRVAYVVYLGGQQYPLYASGLDGTGRAKLADNVGFQTPLLATPDRVVYLARTDNGPPSLFSVRLDGSGTAKLNPAPIEGMPIDPSVTADGSRVVYRAILDRPWVWELYASTIDGANTVRLSGPIAPANGVSSFRPIPGDRVLYIADQDGDGTQDLYATHLDGSGVVNLSHGLQGSVVAADFAVNADGSRVVYRVADPQTNTSRLYAAATDGSRTWSLFDGPSRFKFVDPQGTRVAVLGGSAGFDLHVLELRPDGEFSGVRLQEGGSFFPLLVTPDGSRALFRGAEDPSGATRLSVVALDGSGATDLDVALPKLGPNGLDEGAFVLR